MRADWRFSRALRLAILADRRALDATQEAAGSLCGVTQTTVSRWESGEWAVSAEYVAALAEAGSANALATLCEAAGRQLGGVAVPGGVEDGEARAAAGRVAMLAGELGAAVLGGDWRRAGEAARALGEAAAVVAARGAR